MWSYLFGDDISKIIKKDEIDEYGDYSLDERNIERFLRECDDKIRPIIRKIIENTKYISFREFMRSLFKSTKDLNDVLMKMDKKIIYLYECRCKCNRWIFKYLNRIIKYLNPEIKVKVINDRYKNFKDDDFIILPFDCLQTGFQITKNTKILCNNNKKKKRIDIYVLSPYMSSYGIYNMMDKEMEREYHYKLHIGSHNKIDEYLITEVLTFKEIELLSEYYPQISSEDKYDSNLDNIYFFYFNHKLGDLHSTLTLLYMGVVANISNRKQLQERIHFYQFGKYRKINEDEREEIERQHYLRKKEMERGFKLQVIPLIKNCNYVYRYENINTENPICPPPI